jgi:hypothetical protein
MRFAGKRPQRTADYLEIDWQGGVPVATTSRYGVGYFGPEVTEPPRK